MRLPAALLAVAALEPAARPAVDAGLKSLSRPGGPGRKPAKNVAPITYAGTAWAILGLVRSGPTEGAPGKAK